MVRSVPLIILLVLALCVLIQHSNACGGSGGSGGGGGSNDGGSSNRNSRPGYPFRSSQINKQIGEKNYPGSEVEAPAVGDELPNMRDDLIDRKNKGEGFVERHIIAWTNPKNWERDPNDDRKETKDPAKGK